MVIVRHDQSHIVQTRADTTYTMSDQLADIPAVVLPPARLQRILQEDFLTLNTILVAPLPAFLCSSELYRP